MSDGVEASVRFGAPASTNRNSWLPRIIAIGAAFFVLAMVAVRWDAHTGLTSLLRFGEDLRDRRIPALAGMPVATKPNLGYDGQFYGQLAVSPFPHDAEVQRALDNPGYRLRRILLPVLAHLGGGGDPWRVLHVYAILNVVAWLVTAWLLWRIVSPSDLRGSAVWIGCMLSLGVLDSVRMALTDLPAILVTIAAVLLAQQSRLRGAVGLLAMGALVRETVVFSTLALDTRSWNGDSSIWRARLVRVFWVALPVGLWTAWLIGRVANEDPLGRANFDWPLVALVSHARTWFASLAGGNLDSRYLFGLLAIVSFSWQSITLLRQWRSQSAWVRMGLPFAALFWVLGDAVWHGYWAVARACLPMTIAYNLTLPRDGSFWWRWCLGNICLLHAVYRFLPE